MRHIVHAMVLGARKKKENKVQVLPPADLHLIVMSHIVHTSFALKG